MDFEKVFPELCTYGRYQRLIYLFVLLPAQLPLYVHLFSHLFFTYQPQHWCKADHLLGAFASTPTSPSTSSFSAFNSNTTSSTSVLLGQSLQSSEAMRRFFFTPSTFVVRSWNSPPSSDNSQQQQKGLLNVSQILEAVNYSLLHYVQHSLDSCTLYNASQEELVRYHQRFLQLFAQLTPPPTSSADDSFSSNYKPNIASAEELLLTSPPIAGCNDWAFNETWLAGDQSIVTKWNLVCQHEWLQLVPLAALFFGLLCGYPLYYLLWKSIGYRRTYFVLLLAQCSAGSASAFVADLSHFSLLRFVIGLSLPAAAVLPADLMVESAGVRVIRQTILAGEVVRLGGALVAGLVAQHIADYRHLSVALSLPFLVFAFLWWSFPESTNYLLVSGQIARLEKLVLDIAHTNFPQRSNGRGAAAGAMNICRDQFEAEPSFDESIKRRIYTELAIYRELMISSLMHDSLGRRLDSYINGRSGSNSSSSNNNSSKSNSNNSSIVGGGSGGYIDYSSSADAGKVTTLMMKNLSPGRRKERNHSSEDEMETAFKNDEVVKSNSPSTLIEKLNKHLEGKEDSDNLLMKTPIPNGKIATTTTSPQPEIWSEAESETDASSSSVPRLTASKRKISSPRLLVPNNPPRPLSSPTPANFLLPRASVHSTASSVPSKASSSPSASIGKGHISSSSSSGATAAAPVLGDPNKSFKLQGQHTTLLTILRLPNMRRKCLVLFFLSSTHTTLYVAFTYFVTEFTSASSKDGNLYQLFSLSIGLNFVAVALVWVSLRLHFGRKFTFLSANLLASVFTLCTGFSMSSTTWEDDRMMHQPNSMPQNATISSSSSFLLYYQHSNYHHLLPLFLYSLAKIFQSSTYLILLIWLYELLPPAADCSAALRVAFTLAHLHLAVVMPLLLYSTQKSLKLTLLLPEYFVEQFNSKTSSNRTQFLCSLPLHYLTAALLLSVCGLLCLLLPETVAVDDQQQRQRLPCSLQEAELFGAVSESGGKWYSLKVLFSFRPPNILPASGILKKGGTSNGGTNCNGVKHCGRAPVQSGKNNNVNQLKKKAPPFLFDAVLEAKLASLSKEAANQTAINSLYNQFLGMSGGGGNASIINANSAASPGAAASSSGNFGNRRSFDSVGSSGNFSRRSPSNERHQSASWMSAVADAAATGVPLFVPVPSPTHQAGNALGQAMGAKGVSAASGGISYEQYHHHHQQYYQNQTQQQQQQQQQALSHKSSAFHPVPPANRRHSMQQQQQQQNDPSGHHHHQNYHQHQHFSAKDLKMGSHADLHFTGTVIDLPDGSGKSIGTDLQQLQQLYPSQKTLYHSLPRVQSMDGSHQHSNQQHLWSTTGDHLPTSGHDQLARWLDSHGLIWTGTSVSGLETTNGAAAGGAASTRSGGPAAVRILDIIDTNNGLSSGQIDAYGLMEPSSSTTATAFTDFSTLLDDDGGLHFDSVAPVAFIPLDI